jgi:hypothetical protein
MKGRVLDSNKRHVDKLNKDIWDVNVESGGKTTKYQCWSAHIAEMNGKEIEFSVKPAPEGTSFLPTLELPRGDGNTFAKKPWTGGASKQSFDPNTMILSYSKDLIVAMMEHSKKEHTPVGIANATVAIYRVLKNELNPPSEVPSIEKFMTPEQAAKALGGKVVDDGGVIF